MEKLRKVGANILGIALTDIDASNSHSSYYYYYQTKSYSQYYEAEKNTQITRIRC